MKIWFWQDLNEIRQELWNEFLQGEDEQTVRMMFKHWRVAKCGFTWDEADAEWRTLAGQRVNPTKPDGVDEKVWPTPDEAAEEAEYQELLRQKTDLEKQLEEVNERLQARAVFSEWENS